MGKEVLPPVASLDAPEPLTTLLSRDKAAISQADCLPCKVTGAAAFIGLGAYTYWSGHKQLLDMRKEIAKSFFGLKSRQMGINGIAMTLLGMGVYRLVV